MKQEIYILKECVNSYLSYMSITQYTNITIFFFFSLVCQLSVDLVTNALEASSASQMTCYLPTRCTAVECCVEVPAISTSFNAHVDIDPCNYMLRIGIEKFSFNKSLDQYSFGEFHLNYKTNILMQQCFNLFK